MIKNFAANLKIGAALSSSVGRVFGSLNSKIKAQEATLKGLRAEYKLAAKGSGEFAGSLNKLEKEIGEAEAKLKKLRAASKIDIGAGFKNIGTTFGGDLKRLGVAAGVTAGAITAVGASIYSVTRGFVDWADDIGDSAEALNMSTQALQTWQFAAATVGVGGSKMTASIARLSKAISEGGKATDEALGKLGVNGARLKKLSLDQQLEVVAEAFKDYKGADRAAIAMKLFGKSGYQLAGILAKGKKGLDEFRKAGEKAGAVLDDDAAKAAGDAASALDMLGITLVGLRNQIAIQFVPVFQRLTARFTEFVRDNGPALRKWAADFGSAIETRVVPAIGTMLEKLPGVVDQISSLVTKFADGVVKVKDFVGGWDNLGLAILAVNFAPTIVAVGTLGKSLLTLSAATYSALGPWAALAAAVAGVWYLWENPDKAIAGLNAVFGEERVNAFGSFWAKLYSDVEQWGYRMVDKGTENREAMKKAWSEAADWIGVKWQEANDKITNAIAQLKSEFRFLAQSIRDAFTGVFDWIGQKFDELVGKAAALGAKIKGFFSFGGGGEGKETSMRVPTVAPPDAMPGADKRTANNTVNIKIDAPGQDGAGIARQLRQELNRKPLFDYDGALVPA